MIRLSLLAKVGRLGKYPQISSVFQCVINTFLGARVMEPDWCVLEFYRESNNSSGFLDAIASLLDSMSVRPSVASLDFDNLMSCHSHF